MPMIVPSDIVVVGGGMRPPTTPSTTHIDARFAQTVVVLMMMIIMIMIQLINLHEYRNPYDGAMHFESLSHQSQLPFERCNKTYA